MTKPSMTPDQLPKIEDVCEEEHRINAYLHDNGDGTYGWSVSFVGGNAGSWDKRLPLEKALLEMHVYLRDAARMLRKNR